MDKEDQPLARFKIEKMNRQNEMNEKLISIIKNYEYVYTLEEHNITSGFGSNLISSLNSLNIFKKIKCFGIENKFTDAVGDQNYLREKYIGKNTDILNKIKSKI